MDSVISALIGELISRFISFIVEKSRVRAAATNISTDTKPRLQRLLLRARIVVEEAAGRQVTNRGMLLQLQKLRAAMYRGYYVLDTSEIPPSRTKSRGVPVDQCKLQSYTDNLEATLDGMKEFLLILMHCPLIVRHPYNTYLFMERCMFGRHAEKERIISFLLHPCSSLDVLPVIGPCYVGKRTLVEHVCRDEVVQTNFSHILRLNSDDLNNLAHNRRKQCLSDGSSRYLIIVELVHHTDVVAWGEIRHSLRHGADGIKIILISKMDYVSSLGTVQALRLARLHQEEYWYFFRVLAFGSANPYDCHPDLTLIGKAIATEIDGSFMFAHVITGLLRANMNMQFWRRVLWWIRKSVQMHKQVFGEDPWETQSNRLSYFHSLNDDDPPAICYNKYTRRYMMPEDTAGMSVAGDVHNARSMKYGEKFDTIFQSHIPPYYSYIANFVVGKPQQFDAGNKCLKRKRNR